jgi:hypothetical protein
MAIEVVLAFIVPAVAVAVFADPLLSGPDAYEPASRIGWIIETS